MTDDHRQTTAPQQYPNEPLDQRVARLEDTIWGPWRTNGLAADVKAIREFQEEQTRNSRAVSRAAMVAMAAAIVALLVALSSVIVMYQVAI